MSRNQLKNGRRKTKPFVMLDRAMVLSDEWASLSSHAIKLLVQLLAQYRGNNNGDLDIRWNRLGKAWNSKSTLYRAKDELVAKGFVIQTRQGGKNYPSLYAITFQPYDECKGKSLAVRPTRKPENCWRKN